MKQISYPTFFSRIFAAVIDLLIISSLLGPILSYFQYHLIISEFADFFAEMQVDVYDKDSVYEALATTEFMNFMSEYAYKRSIIISFVSLFMQLFLIGICTIFSIYKFGTTPGKFIIRAKVVDASTLHKPSLIQTTKRFLVSCFSMIGFWFILFSKKNQAMHDKFAKTIVVKI